VREQRFAPRRAARAACLAARAARRGAKYVHEL